MSDDDKTGARFSHVYIDRGSPTADSQRARIRIASTLHQYCSEIGLADTITAELGIPLTRLYLRTEFLKFFETAQLIDALDAVTVAIHALARQEQRDSRHYGLSSSSSAPRLMRDIARIFREENVGYVLDAKGGVRHYVDAEFAHSKVATIASLSGTKHAATLDFFERAHRDLDANPPDSRNAVRHVFDSAENLFKSAYGVSRLDPSVAKKKLQPVLALAYGGPAARAAASQQLEAFCNWISAAYQYRHAEGSDSLDPPPVDLAVSIVSAGACHLRWLAGLIEMPSP